MAGVLIAAGSSLLPYVERYGIKEVGAMIGKSVAIGTGSYAVRNWWEDRKKSKKKRKKTAKHIKKKKVKKHGRR